MWWAPAHRKSWWIWGETVSNPGQDKDCFIMWLRCSTYYTSVIKSHRKLLNIKPFRDTWKSINCLACRAAYMAPQCNSVLVTSGQIFLGHKGFHKDKGVWHQWWSVWQTPTDTSIEISYCYNALQVIAVGEKNCYVGANFQSWRSENRPKQTNKQECKCMMLNERSEAVGGR